MFLYKLGNSILVLLLLLLLSSLKGHLPNCKHLSNLLYINGHSHMGRFPWVFIQFPTANLTHGEDRQTSMIVVFLTQ